MSPPFERMSAERLADLIRLNAKHFGLEFDDAHEALSALQAERKEVEGAERLFNAEMEHSEHMRQQLKAAEARIKELEIPARIAADMKVRAEAAEAKLEAVRGLTQYGICTRGRDGTFITGDSRLSARKGGAERPIDCYLIRVDELEAKLNTEQAK